MSSLLKLVFPCPALRNPSDHFLRCISSDFDKVKATLKGSMKLRFESSGDPLEKITTAEATRTLISYYATSQQHYSAQQRVNGISRVKGTVLDAGGNQASFLMQTFTLTNRLCYYWLRLVIYVVVTICIGTIFFNVGTSFNSILARGSCASFVFGFVNFMSIGGFPSFVEDMKVFQRERLNGHYGVTAFVISNTISAMPFFNAGYLCIGDCVLLHVRLHPGLEHYVFFVLCLYASVTVVESLMMAIASIVPNFSWDSFGFPRTYKASMALSYVLHQFPFLGSTGCSVDNRTPNLPKIPGEYVLENVFQIDVTRSKWVDLSVIFSMTIVYRIIFFVMIKINEDVTPWIGGYIARRRIQHKNSNQNYTTVIPDRLSQSPSLRAYVARSAAASNGINTRV
ncbi:ABC transporter G family member 11 [Bienertia sinuspersici]